MNCNLNLRPSSLYEGVEWDDKRDKWSVNFEAATKRKRTGYFEDELVAAKAFDAFVIAHRVDACLNFPADQEAIDSGHTTTKIRRVPLSRYIGVTWDVHESKWLSNARVASVRDATVEIAGGAASGSSRGSASAKKPVEASTSGGEVQQRTVFLGFFHRTDEADAARAYDTYVLQHSLTLPLNFEHQRVSAYRGVQWDRVRRKWSVQIEGITVNGTVKREFIGHFTEEVRAALAYDQVARAWNLPLNNITEKDMEAGATASASSSSLLGVEQKVTHGGDRRSVAYRQLASNHTGASGYYGVARTSKTEWVARVPSTAAISRVTFNRKDGTRKSESDAVFIGTYPSALEAAQNYDRFMTLNKIKGHTNNIAARDRIVSRPATAHRARAGSGGVSGKARAATSSRYRGVSWSKRSKKWRTEISVGGEKVRLGVYDKEVEAAKAYDQYVRASKLQQRPGASAESKLYVCNFEPNGRETRGAGARPREESFASSIVSRTNTTEAKYTKIGRKFKKRCLDCVGCTRENCGKCKYCRDKPCFGGEHIVVNSCL